MKQSHKVLAAIVVAFAIVGFVGTIVVLTLAIAGQFQ